MIVGRIFAMARPSRPAQEREAVRAAAVGSRGSKAQCAHRLAERVATAALAHLDGEPVERVLALLAALEASPVAILVADPEIDTAAAIRTERARRMESRGWRKLKSAEDEAEDRAVIQAVTELLAKRYARALVGF